MSSTKLKRNLLRCHATPKGSMEKVRQYCTENECLPVDDVVDERRSACATFRISAWASIYGYRVFNKTHHLVRHLFFFFFFHRVEEKLVRSILRAFDSCRKMSRLIEVDWILISFGISFEYSIFGCFKYSN